MSTKKNFSVAAIGIPANEQKILKNIFKLSLYRARSYTLSEMISGQSVDILLVNGDDPNAIRSWHSLNNTDTSSIPTLIVSQQKPSDAQLYHIRRPLIATRVLGALDQIAIKELHFIPEMVIDENSKLSASTAETIQQSVSAQEEQPRFKALVVDDSRPIRKQIELELQLFGAQMDFAETGEQALEFATQGVYDIIFLDVMLPGIDGYKVCKSIKKQKLTNKTPVVMLTGKSSPFDRVRGKLSGCNTYLTKPVSHDSFQKVVKKYLL